MQKLSAVDGKEKLYEVIFYPENKTVTVCGPIIPQVNVSSATAMRLPVNSDSVDDAIRVIEQYLGPDSHCAIDKDP